MAREVVRHRIGSLTLQQTSALNSTESNITPMWYAAYTSARHEKRVADHLDRRQLECFLPLYETVHQWKNGRKKLQLPLLPGYVFVRIPLQERLRILEVPGVAYLVGKGNIPVPIGCDEIQMVRHAILTGKIGPYPFLNIGERVRIVAGALAGSEGILLRKKQNLRVVLSVELLARSVVIDVDGSEVEPIKSHPRPQIIRKDVANGSW
jgi:transcription antitermination factor NusG